MIVTKSKTKEKILSYLGNYKKVFLVGCNTCAKLCKTGGMDEVLAMEQFLKEHGIEVTGIDVLDEGCHIQLAKKELRLHKDELKRAECLLVLSCGAGVQAVSQNTDIPAFPALDSMYLASSERVGIFIEECSLCGDCVLGETAGICPVTQCPKGLLNGPCGGVKNRKCEVSSELDCAWVKIYEKLKKQNRVKVMRIISPPKNHLVSLKPRRDNVR